MKTNTEDDLEGKALLGPNIRECPIIRENSRNRPELTVSNAGTSIWWNPVHWFLSYVLHFVNTRAPKLFGGSRTRVLSPYCIFRFLIRNTHARASRVILSEHNVYFLSTDDREHIFVKYLTRAYIFAQIEFQPF